MSDHQLPVHWHGRMVGHLPVPVNIRPPMSDVEIAEFSLMLPVFIRSASFLFNVRPGDFKLQIIDGEMSILANMRLGPGDIGCIKGLIPADPVFERDEHDKALEEAVIDQFRKKAGRA